MIGRSALAARNPAEEYLAGLSLTSQGIEKAILSLAEASGTAPVRKSGGTRHAWGAETVIFESERIRIKSFEVDPGKEMAPGLHLRRSEHWVVAEGRAHMNVGGSTVESGPDESHYIPAGTRHYLKNPGRTRLVVIEVQCGEDLSEPDTEVLAGAAALDGRVPGVAAAGGGGRPLRVLHVYKTFLPDSVGGLENAIAQMAVSTRRLGVETRILSLSRHPQPHFCHYRTTEHYRYQETASIASNSMSLSLLADFGRHVAWADVIHYHFPWPFADLLHLLWRVRKPSIVTYHSDIVRQRTLLALYRPLMRSFLNRVDRVVATSPNYVKTSDVLRDYADKTTVIPIGLDPASYPSTPAKTLARWKAAVGENFFLFIGVIRYYKGLHILLDALAGTPLPTVIVGSGPIEHELRCHAERAGLTHVRFLGSVSEEDKVALLQLSAAVVFPSHLRSEAFGVTLLEGAMFGKPLISSEIGTGTSYINVDGETGLVVPPSDPVALRNAMLRLDGDAELRRRMGAAAQKRFVERFTADQMALCYRDLYREVTARSALALAAASPASG